MATINVSIRNGTSNDYIIHVFDLFGGGTSEVVGSPFFLGKDEQSPFFLIQSGGDGVGKISYRVDGGPSLTNIDVQEGDSVEVD